MKTLRPRLARFALIPLALVLTASCGGASDDVEGNDGPSGGGPGGQAGGEPPAMRGMTAAHNRARAAVDPPADPPLRPLSWSPEIAAAAQAYAEKCVWEHSETGYGENLYATSGTSATPDEVVATWLAEVDDYDLESNTCSAICGHYTQVVWADSLELGCGVADCTSGSPRDGGAWQIWVCNYDPPGNYVGERPY
ncbi:CAP domain-containing protein [Sorangium sp. So ce131]|uniref:CAP domain-containing protein n=1 Tax=Sorangium sp. So ce131 TaxID=3133282 RepID=UPI003F5F2999